jgi:hypothetical protein
MITIEITQKILAPLSQVSEALLAHANLDRFFNAKIELVTSENDGELLGGKGAVRQIAIGNITFEEKIISATLEHICYRIIGKGPVSNHQGDIRLTPTGDDNQSTQLDYVIQFKGPSWLPDFLLKHIVGRDIKNAMQKLALYFEVKHSSAIHSSTGESA